LATVLVVALGLWLLVASVRYQYVSGNGTVWRIDRFTGQACQVVRGGVNCTPTPNKSVSTSTSTSTSTSLSPAVHPKPPKKS
jgi:hypothetical protein